MRRKAAAVRAELATKGTASNDAVRVEHTKYIDGGTFARMIREAAERANPASG